jgi:RNA polymerase-binding transcription factor DksA
MADEVDAANDHAEKMLQVQIKNARKPLETGTPGECDFCGEHFSRLIRGACGGCRDKYKLG